jgi:hypothetical protein
MKPKSPHAYNRSIATPTLTTEQHEGRTIRPDDVHGCHKKLSIRRGADVQSSKLLQNFSSMWRSPEIDWSGSSTESATDRFPTIPEIDGSGSSTESATDRFPKIRKAEI